MKERYDQKSEINIAELEKAVNSQMFKRALIDISDIRRLNNYLKWLRQVGKR